MGILDNPELNQLLDSVRQLEGRKPELVKALIEKRAECTRLLGTLGHMDPSVTAPAAPASLGALAPVTRNKGGRPPGSPNKPKNPPQTAATAILSAMASDAAAKETISKLELAGYHAPETQEEPGTTGKLALVDMSHVEEGDPHRNAVAAMIEARTQYNGEPLAFEAPVRTTETEAERKLALGVRQCAECGEDFNGTGPMCHDCELVDRHHKANKPAPAPATADDDEAPL